MARSELTRTETLIERGYATAEALDIRRSQATSAAAAVTPADLMAEADTLEDAFVALLPGARRHGDRPTTIAPHVVVDGPPAIEADGLTMQFGDFTAVNNVSFRITRGEIFGFLGSNGCGKTTTMKMLTGLLTPTNGSARLFGVPVGADGMAARRRVGYMSQSFSLYGELMVRGNLDLHAALFHLPRAQRTARIGELLDRFGLRDVADALPKSLSLGLRQRLQLATAVLHKPDLLILDEPTSGVDPVARDEFWDMLTELSRDDGVTIFISTHFMNEAERCDRISLMHAGKVLAEGAPRDLTVARGEDTLEDAFIGYMIEAGADGDVATQSSALPAPVTGQRDTLGTFARIWAFARRETQELVRDPIRLGFALLGPLALMFAMGFGITFDVENLSYAVLDQDQSREGRMLDEAFANSRYFLQKPPIRDLGDLDQRMLEGQIATALVISPNFGCDLLAGRGAELGVWFDGSNTVRAETARGFVQGVVQNQLRDLMLRETGVAPDMTLAQLVELRFRYNQAFRSQYAIPPGVLMLLLILIPAMLTALGVVREKEMGSIVNLYAAPARSIEFLLGKQMPYVAVAMASFASLVVMMVVVFGVPAPSSPVAMILYAFSAAIYIVAKGVKTELSNAAIAVVDEDQSPLSARISGALMQPFFKPPAAITLDQVDALMDAGRYSFVLDIPPGLEADLLAGKAPVIQLNVDATAMSIAGNGALYIQSIVTAEVVDFLSRGAGVPEGPVSLKVRAKYNPNLDSAWFMAVMQVINNVSILAVILSGAAVIRERERGTIEHVLAMPVSVVEIMMAKVWANGLVVVVAPDRHHCSHRSRVLCLCLRPVPCCTGRNHVAGGHHVPNVREQGQSSGLVFVPVTPQLQKTGSCVSKREKIDAGQFILCCYLVGLSAVNHWSGTGGNRIVPLPLAELYRLP